MQLARKPPRQLTPDEEIRAVDLYRGGMSAMKVAGVFGCSEPLVFKILRKHGVSRRSLSLSHRRYGIDESRFSVWDDDSLYWAGLLAADGSLSAGGSVVTLVQSSRDAAHVEQLRVFLGCDRPLVVVKSPRSSDPDATLVRFVFNSRVIHARLTGAGIRPGNKSRVAPELAASPHFWRGVVDGDGCVNPCSPDGSARLELVGGEELLGQFLAFAKSVSPGIRSTVRPHKSIWRVVTAGPPAALLLRALYPEGCVSLDRKREAVARTLAAY